MIEFTRRGWYRVTRDADGQEIGRSTDLLNAAEIAAQDAAASGQPQYTIHQPDITMSVLILRPPDPPPVDTTPPSSVGAITIQELPGPTHRLAWGAATDNVAVVGYQVEANGSASYREVAGTTVDYEALPNGAIQNYSIRAFDGASPRNYGAWSRTVSATTTATIATSQNWPVAYPNVSVVYQIGTDQATQMGSDPYRQYIGEKDAVVFQAISPTVSGAMQAQHDRMRWFADNRPWCRPVMYTNPGVQVKSQATLSYSSANASYTPNGNYTIVQADILRSATDRNLNWALVNAANVRLEHEFNPTLQWKMNEADLVAGTNSLGEKYSECFHRKWEEYLTTPDQRPYLHGFYRDVSPPMPQGVTVNLGATGSAPDYDNNGVNESITSNTEIVDASTTAQYVLEGGAVMWRRGFLSWQDELHTRFPAGAHGAAHPGYQYIWNAGRFYFDYSDSGSDDPPLPLSSNQWYGRVDSGIWEFFHNTMGLKPSGSSLVYQFNGWSGAWRGIKTEQAYLRDSAAVPWGYSFIALDVDGVNRASLSAGDYHYYRFYWACHLLEENLACGVKVNKQVPLSLDECLFHLGAPLSTRSMGSLNEDTLDFSLRPADASVGSAAFYWAEFADALVVVRGDTTGVGANAVYPAGSSVTCTLPTAGTGYHWETFNGSTYVSPEKGLQCRNNDPTWNDGATKTTTVMRCFQAQAFRRVAN